MQTYISLLRGINVSGSKKIKMVELKALYEKLKFKEVQTFIQSGNVIFKSNKSEAAIIKTIYDGLKKEWGYDVIIILKTPTEIQEIIAANPFSNSQHVDIKKLYFTFLDAIPEKSLIAALDEFDTNGDEFTIKGKVIYLCYSENMSTSKLHNNFFERKLKVGATTRNLNSLNRMCAKALD